MSGSADDFHERSAGSVDVNKAGGRAVGGGDVGQARGVLFQVDARDANAGRCAVDLNVKVAVDAERQVVLGNLVPLHQVGVGVVLAVELGVLGNLAIERQAGADGVVHGLAIDDRQDAWHAQADGADVGVGPSVGVVGGAAAKHLALGAELDVSFQANDRCGKRWRVVIGHQSP